ncbi:MAG: ABC transporter permease [Candidatus Bipolaricaulota bacterium]|nr:ABC transporter permease [Candidatus Bipolaricaulota bacterium]MDW8110636.1 ABC transporter permease [Candidatus Bipolaricaulota bacterium]MDW8328506.1 ABC transporter permease [Candidatus Bipolaricaulota bacterium]
MRETLAVARWEFWQSLKSKTFLIATFATPLISIGFIALVILITRTAAGNGETQLAVLDRAGVFSELQDRLRDSTYRLIAVSGPEADLPQRMKRGEFDGYLVIEADFFESRQARYVPKPREGLRQINLRNLEPQSAPRAVREALSQILVARALQDAGLPSERAHELSQGVQIVVAAAPEAALEQMKAGLTISVGFAIIFLLFFITMNSISWILYSVISEKRNRVVEILLSSITAYDLMSGKILGLGGLALVQAAIWAVVGLTVIFVGGPYVGIPTTAIGLAILPFLAWEKLLLYLAYFVLGYLLLAALSAALSAIMSDDLQSASSFGFSLVFIPPILPLMLFSLVLEKPDHVILKIVSFFPPATPGMMILRTAVGDVPWWEVLLSLIVLALGTYGTMRLAGKIFKTGILMYGKSPTLRELWRWVKT